MNQLLSRRSLLGLVVLLMGALLVIYLQPASPFVSKDEPLQEIQSIETLRTQFNRDAGKTRLILLLSPT